MGGSVTINHLNVGPTKVIIALDDQRLDRIEPLVFRDLEALKAYFHREGWDDDSDYPLLLQALERGESFCDASTYIGWREIISL